jgi:large subunit ribosomal protein L29
VKPKDLRERSVEDLRELEKSLVRDTFTHRFKNFTNRLDDTSMMNKTRRDVARVKTILRQLELNASTATATASKGEAPTAAAAAPASTSEKKPKKTAAKKTAKKDEAK